jgi:hypothetical protein
LLRKTAFEKTATFAKYELIIHEGARYYLKRRHVKGRACQPHNPGRTYLVQGKKEIDWRPSPITLLFLFWHGYHFQFAARTSMLESPVGLPYGANATFKNKRK